MLCSDEGLCALVGPLHTSSVAIGVLLGVVASAACASLACGLCSRAVASQRASQRASTIALLLAVYAFAVYRRRSWQAIYGPLPAVCPAETDYLMQQSDVGESVCAATAGRWQSQITDKIGGAAFARSLGVGTPRLFYFGALGGLPSVWPPSWGRHLVVKPLSEFSSRGVLLLVDGYDRRLDATFAGRDDVRRLYAANASAGRNAYWRFATRGLSRRRASTTSVIVEELLLGLHGGPADDYKFYTFGPTIGAAYYATNRFGSDARNCLAWYDGALEQRIDGTCVANANSSRHGPEAARAHASHGMRARARIPKAHGAVRRPHAAPPEQARAGLPP